MKIKVFASLFLAFFVMALNAQDSLNVSKVGRLDYPNSNLNDVWGYSDANGNEYALVGTEIGFSIVDISQASNPVEKGNIPGAFSIWRDIKTWSHYAYVIHDGHAGPSDGILIVDLDSVNQSQQKYSNFFPTITVDTNSGSFIQAHNLYIDENGILYVFGAAMNGIPGGDVNGALMFDLNPDPENPVFVGVFNEHYLHDGMARGDTLWGSAIYEGKLLAIDVSDKTNPVILGSIATPNNFTHNAWVSDDNKTVYTTDEKPGAYVTAIDVSNPGVMQELDRIQQSIDTSQVIPHNTHVYGDFLVNSYYTSGLQIVDISKPEIMVEVGIYDTSPLANSNFEGAWGAYPYLPSGLILVTDRQTGLWILNPSYVKASFFTGLVKDSVSGINLVGASVKITNTGDSLATDIFGKFGMGFASSGAFQVEVSHPGYQTLNLNLSLTSGVETYKEIALLPNDFSVEEAELQKFDLSPNPSTGSFSIQFPAETSGINSRIEIYSMKGQLVYSEEFQTDKSKTQVHHNLKAGVYQVVIKNNNFNFQPVKVLLID
tara:strand:- start:4227 stop:5858 length:1632 start_codon:yes stop_codon:yes gene_type:complete